MSTKPCRCGFRRLNSAGTSQSRVLLGFHAEQKVCNCERGRPASVYEPATRTQWHCWSEMERIMGSTQPRLDDQIEVKVREVQMLPRGRLVLTARSGLYSLLILAVALGAGAYGLRRDGIFSCQA